ncbi:GTP cyclohydrolase 1 [subsurface metagenome]
MDIKHPDTEDIEDKVRKPNYIEKGVHYILLGLANDYGLDLTDVNFEGTPKRVARMYGEIFGGIKDTKQQIKNILDSSFPSTNKEMIIAKNISVYSMCPHHFLPVSYSVDLGYIPNGNVLGVSKLTRLVEILAKRPVLQETLTEEIANYLQKINTLGVMVIVKGQHYCMKMRGVKQQNSTIITSAVRGVFDEDIKTRNEFMELVK